MSRLGAALLTLSACGAHAPGPTAPTVAVPLDAPPEKTKAAPPPPRRALPCRLEVQKWQPNVAGWVQTPALWVDGFGEPFAIMSPGVTMKVEMKPQASRIAMTLSGGGFEVTGWVTTSTLNIYLRQPQTLGGVVKPYPTSPVHFRGFEGGRLSVGYVLRDGVVPDIVDLEVRCADLTLARPPAEPVDWNRSRPTAELSTGVRIPMRPTPSGPIAVELAPDETEYEIGLVEIVETRGADTKVRWVRQRETLEGWIASVLTKTIDLRPEKPELPEADEVEEDRLWSGVDPDDSLARVCERDVKIFLASFEDETPGYEAPIEVGRITAGTFFRVTDELYPEAKAKEPMHHIESNALEALTGTGAEFAVLDRETKGCRHP